MFSSLTPQLQIALIAMLPIAEVRLAIPLGLTWYTLPWWEVVLMSVLGNVIAASAVYLGLHACGDTLIHRVPLLHKHVEKYLNRARHVFTGKHERWGVLGLVLFVGIPLPMTGGWTGAAAAYVFGFPKKKSLAALAGGIVLASLIMLIATIGVEFIVRWFIALMSS